MSINYPGALDALANPGPTTETDDAGFELDLVISRIHDIVEALEAKVGTSDPGSSDLPLGNTVFGSTGAGRGGWRKILTSDIQDGTITTVDLLANAVTQISRVNGVTSAPAITSATYSNMTDMAVTLTTVGGPLLVIASGAFYNTSGTPANATFGLSLDGAAEVAENSFTSTAANMLQVVTCLELFSGVSAASHEVRWKWKTAGGTLTNHLTMRRMIMMELKR